MILHSMTLATVGTGTLSLALAVHKQNLSD